MASNGRRGRASPPYTTAPRLSPPRGWISTVVCLSWLSVTLCSTIGAAESEGVPLPVDPGAVQLDVNAAAFPDGSLIDFSYLLSPPAGRRGYLSVDAEGRFVFEDGAPVRFWGINVAKDSVFQPKATIDAAVNAIARAGFNLVRLHHLDDVAGLLPPESPSGGGRIDPDKLDAVDYWIARLATKGIHVYLDLLAYRTFREWEGVPGGEALGRGAKPYAVFDERLIELQQEYAAELLVRHVNPYTGLAYADDPSVCLVELCDENGLLRRPALLMDLVEPYASDLQRRWNAWLAARYGDTSALRRAWGRSLGHDEDLARESVDFRNGGDPALPGVRGDMRRADLHGFAYETHRAYFRRMREFLRGEGVRVPITAVLRPGLRTDVRAVSAELDCVATNFYWDHPFYPAGRQWQPPALYRNENEIASGGVETFVSATETSRVAGKPLIVREWNACWPNKFRAATMLTAAAYANLQRYDGMILFTYDTRESARKLSFFDVSHDPARWGLVGPAAKCFLGEDGAFASSTGELRRDEDAGVLSIDAPFFQAIGGHLGGRPELRTSQLSLVSQSPIGALCGTTFDGKPLAESQHYVLKMVSFAINTDEEKRLHGRDQGRDIYALTSGGRAPVRTLGRATDTPTSITVQGRRLVDIYMADGTWELVREPGRFLLFCDTPGIRFVIHDLPKALTVARYLGGGMAETELVEQPVVYPPSTRCLRLTAGGPSP